MLARHYTDYSPERLKRIYDGAGLKVIVSQFSYFSITVSNDPLKAARKEPCFKLVTQITSEGRQVKVDYLIWGIELFVGGLLLISLGITHAVGSVWSPGAPSIRPAFLAFVAFWIGLIITIIGILLIVYGIIAEPNPWGSSLKKAACKIFPLIIMSGFLRLWHGGSFAFLLNTFIEQDLSNNISTVKQPV